MLYREGEVRGMDKMATKFESKNFTSEELKTLKDLGLKDEVAEEIEKKLENENNRNGDNNAFISVCLIIEKSSVGSDTSHRYLLCTFGTCQDMGPMGPMGPKTESNGSCS